MPSLPPPRLLLFLVPLLLLVILLVQRQFRLLLGATVFSVVVEALFAFAVAHLDGGGPRGADPRPVVCSLPLVAGGHVYAPGRTAFLAFVVGYTGYGMAAPSQATAFAGVLVLGIMDAVLSFALGCFSVTRLLGASALGVTAGALYRHSLVRASSSASSSARNNNKQ